MKVTTVLMVITGSILAILLQSAVHYHDRYQDAKQRIAELESLIEDQKEVASYRLQSLQEQRDRRQSIIDMLAKEQEEKDRDAQAEIDRLERELRDRPVRVRIQQQPGPAGGDCGGAERDPGTDTDAGAADAGATTGLLPPENTRRLGEALTEVERLSAAYNSCRTSLIEGYRNAP